MDVFRGDLLLLGEENQSRRGDVQIWERRLVSRVIKYFINENSSIALRHVDISNQHGKQLSMREEKEDSERAI